MQAKRMALRAMNEIPPVTKLITSTMVRAKQTAAIIHEKYSMFLLRKMNAYGKEIQIRPITESDSGVCTCRTKSSHKHHCVPFKYYSVSFL
jgi:hypothetical protein